MPLPDLAIRPHAAGRPGRLMFAGCLWVLVALPGTAAPAPRLAGVPRAARVTAHGRFGGARETGIEESLPMPWMGEAEVHAGQRVTVCWRSLAGRAEELELVFSLDDGRAFDVRVSPELSGDVCRYQWRVPNVGVRGARMRLRARIDGRERSGPASPEFRIVPNPVGTPGLWVFRHGEWWEDRGGVPFDMPGLVTPPRTPSLSAEDGTLDHAVTVRAPEVELVLGVPAAAYGVVAAAPNGPRPSSAIPQTFQSMRE
jgi:hypothetical protein